MKRSLIISIAIIIAALGAGMYYFSKHKTVEAPAAPTPHVTAIHNAPAAEPVAEAEAPTVEIPVDKQQLMGVKLVNTARANFTHTVRTVGRVGYDEARLSTVSTKVEAWLERLYANTTGMYIKKGDRIAELYSPELIATQQEFLNALKWADEAAAKGDAALKADAERLVEAARKRLGYWDIGAAEIERLAKSRTPQRTFAITSPASGIVVARSAVQGSRMMPGEKIVDIAELSTVWVLADVYEFELADIRPGMGAELTVASYPGKVFHSKVDFIYPVLSSQTRTAKVRLVLPNPGGLLRPEMYADVTLNVPMGSRLAVPSDAIIDTGVRSIVYVEKGEGYFEPREVTRGAAAGGLVEILKGLNDGDRVAASGAFLIDSEAKLRGVVK